MRNLILACSLLLAGLLPGQSRTGNDYAFIFYNTTFTKGWTALPDTRSEANELARELRDNYNFKVETIPNLNLKSLKDKLREINARPFSANDQVLFYFSSHGYYQPQSDNGYLIPTDGPASWEYGDGWLSYAKLREYLATNRAQHVLLALDACYSGAFGRKYKGKPTSSPLDRNADCQTIQRSSLNRKSRLFFTSGNKVERTSAQSEMLNRWLQCLRERPRQGYYAVSNADLQTYINTVMGSTPESGEFSGHEPDGGFVFIHKQACAQKPPPPPQTDDDDAAWRAASQRNTPEAYRGYLALFPGGKYAAAARTLAGPGPDVVTTDPRSTTKSPPDHMIAVAGGTFEMGDQFGDGAAAEKKHTVTLSDFYLDRTELTNEQFATFLNEKGNQSQGGAEWYEVGSSYAKIKEVSGSFYVESGFEQHPVMEVSWYGAIDYCNWRSSQEGLEPVYQITGENIEVNWSANGYRLPTEAEWEYAARSQGRKQRFAGTDDEQELYQYGNFCDQSCTESWAEKAQNDGFEQTAPVGSFRPNGLGLADMSGNVYEWCWDWYGNYSTNRSNPRGPSEGSNRVVRGGGWISSPRYCRTARRINFSPSYRSLNVGFRLARSF